MRTVKLSALLLILVLTVVGAVHSGGLVAAQQVTTTPNDPQKGKERQPPASGRLAQLHKALASSADSHDIIVTLGRIGDPSSVPFLIEALAKMGTVPREGQYAASDTRFHVASNA